MDEQRETGLIGGPEKRPIRLVEHDPGWAGAFETHARVIAGAVGGAALGLEHIGSTSVPGLAAKPVIDILLVVQDSRDESTYVPQLEAAGYLLRVREPEFHEHRMLRTSGRDVHVHVFSAGCPEIERYLTFRDRLRRNSALQSAIRTAGDPPFQGYCSWSDPPAPRRLRGEVFSTRGEGSCVKRTPCDHETHDQQRTFDGWHRPCFCESATLALAVSPHGHGGRPRDNGPGRESV